VKLGKARVRLILADILNWPNNSSVSMHYPTFAARLGNASGYLITAFPNAADRPSPESPRS